MYLMEKVRVRVRIMSNPHFWVRANLHSGIGWFIPRVYSLGRGILFACFTGNTVRNVSVVFKCTGWKYPGYSLTDFLIYSYMQIADADVKNILLFIAC